MAVKLTKSGTEIIASGAGVRVCAKKASGKWSVRFDARRGGGYARVASFPSEGGDTATAVLSDGRTDKLFKVVSVEASKNKRGAEIRIHSECGKHKLSQALTLAEGAKHVHIRSEFSIAGSQRIAALNVPVIFTPAGGIAGETDFAWLPTLRKKPSHVVADQIFRSPAAIIQFGDYSMSLVPDLDVLGEERPLPCCIDLRVPEGGANKPYMRYGFMPYKIDGHVYFRYAPEDAKSFKDEKLVTAFDLLVSSDCKPRAGHRETVRHLWRRYGGPMSAKLDPQAAPFDVYAGYASEYAFERGGIYHEFESGGATVGGTVASTFASKHMPVLLGASALKASLAAGKLLPLLHGVTNDFVTTSPVSIDVSELLIHNTAPRVPPLVMNQAWFNNLRSAYGLYSHAIRAGDAGNAERAARMKELPLSAPMRDGLWPSIVYFPDGKPMWFEGSRAFESVHDYHLPDNAWTGVWMLNWYRDLEKDERLMERALGLGEFLLKAQLPSGAIPPWIAMRPGGFRSRSTLRESAQTAAPGMFLAALGAESGDIKYTESAKKAADFVIERVMPGNKWWDYETFFSCSKKDRRMRDAGAGVCCMNNLCIFWTAEMMLTLYNITREEKYLEAGLRAVDLLCLWQQVWDAPYISINTFGGFGVMNTDAEWNDARQSMFAECLAGYYAATGEREYFERAVAALRSSFTLMLCPENADVAPGNLGMLREKDYGATYENFAHQGYDKRVPGYVMFDWGSGGALAAAARMRQKFGDIYIDADSGNAFGIDFCTVTNCSIGAGIVEVSAKFGEAAGGRHIVIKSSGMKGARMELVLNSARFGKFSAKALNEGIEIITVGGA